MTRVAEAVAVAVAVLALGLLAGCGGTAAPQGGGGGVTPPPAGTGVIQGVVLDASTTTQVVAYAVVAASPSGATTDAAADGTFKLDKLAPGTVTLSVSPGPLGAYWATQVPVSVSNGKTTTVIVTLVPQSMGVPDRVAISPDTVSLDPGGAQQFVAQVWSGSVMLNLSPSWAVEGGIGTITAQGNFVASAQGTGKVKAIAGDQVGTANVTVTAPTAPKVWSTFIDPTQLPAKGGTARFTVHAGDGDGMASVKVEIFAPGVTDPTVLVLVRTAGTDSNGTWAAAYAFPRNSLPYDNLGNQPDQQYDVRFRVKDKSGAETVTKMDIVTVLGLEPPPPPGP
jgi:hypothetical protein